MKRAALVGAGTLAGLAAIIALNPEGATTTAAAAGTSSSTGSAAARASTGSSSSGSTGTSTGSSSSSSVQDGTYTGTAVDVGRGYGTVQVQATVTGGRLVDITALAVPSNDPRSSQISSQAVPMLVQQAISAQSASIGGVSGATYTSTGFAESLRAALVQAGLAS